MFCACFVHLGANKKVNIIQLFSLCADFMHKFCIYFL